MRRRSTTPIWMRRLGVALEWEPRDLWIGVFLKSERRAWVRPGWHIYVCPLPTLVVHLMWMGSRSGVDAP